MSLRRILFLATGLLFQATTGLRRFADEAVPEDEATAVTLDHWRGASEGGFVPPIDSFRQIWRYRYSLEERLQEPMSPSIKLVLGVMSVPQDEAYRKVIRETWLQQRGVCLWSHKPRVDCSVYVAFVIGSSGTGKFGPRMAEAAQRRAREEPGMFVLPVEENMDNGKSMVWFREAVKAFPWATHYGKTDVDSYIYLHKLVHRLSQNRSCVEEQSNFEFIGRPESVRFCSVRPPRACTSFTQACPDSKGCFGEWVSYERSHVPPGGAFRFLVGEFYALSKGLARAVDWVPRGGKEDEETSIYVNDTAARLGKCVAIRKLDVTVHMTRGVNAAFANDF